MAKGFIEDTTLTAIGNAIRNKRELPSEKREYIYEEWSNIPIGTVTKYSHTPNVLDDGTSQGGYANNLSLTDIVTIKGATSLHITITYQAEHSTYDWVCVWGPDETPKPSGTSALSGKLGGSKKTTKEYDIEGDTVTFTFRSDSGGSTYYGYYAVITGEGYIREPQIIDTIVTKVNQYTPSEMVTAIAGIQSGLDTSKYQVLDIMNSTQYAMGYVNIPTSIPTDKIKMIVVPDANKRTLFFSSNICAKPWLSADKAYTWIPFIAMGTLNPTISSSYYHYDFSIQDSFNNAICTDGGSGNRFGYWIGGRHESTGDLLFYYTITNTPKPQLWSDLDQNSQQFGPQHHCWIYYEE